jgi:hypothetical protein
MIIILFESCLIKYLHKAAEQRASSAAYEFGFRWISSKTRYSLVKYFFMMTRTRIKTSTAAVATPAAIGLGFFRPRPFSATTAARTPGI